MKARSRSCGRVPAGRASSSRSRAAVGEGLGQALGQLRDVDPRAQVAGEPFFPGGEAQEAAQRDEPARARGDRQRPPRALRARLQAGQVALVGPQQLPVEPGDVGHADVAAGEVREAPEVGPVLGDGAPGGGAVELEPAEVLGDRLGERDARGHLRKPTLNWNKSPFVPVRCADRAVIAGSLPGPGGHRPARRRRRGRARGLGGP